ncbi:hypothetical protein PEXP_086390 [Penicillium expansum]|nr:hypothetical protein PEXP_086390 [Penicillium expansum]
MGQNGQAHRQPHFTSQSQGMLPPDQPMPPDQMSPAQVPDQMRSPVLTVRASPENESASGWSIVQRQAAMQGHPQILSNIPSNIPSHIKEMLSRMPPGQARAFLMQQRRAALNNMAQNPAKRRLRNVAPNLLHLRQVNNGVEMTPEQCQEMDCVSFSPSILNMADTSIQVPQNIKSWGQHKQRAASNPGTPGLPRLLILQKLHLGQLIMRSSQWRNNLAQQGAPYQGVQNKFPNSQGLLVGQQISPSNMAGIRPIFAQDIQMARDKLGPPSSNFTDEEIRGFRTGPIKNVFMKGAQIQAYKWRKKKHAAYAARASEDATSIPYSSSRLRTSHTQIF